MAKRFTDTDKWKKPFIRSMKAPYKLLWLYILDECDHAGIWQVDIEVAQIKIGEKLNIKDALKFFDGKIYVFDNGCKWFVYDFIDFQYGILNPQNRAHNSVLNILSKYNIDLNKPLTSPLQGAMDMDKDMDKDIINKEEIIEIVEKTEFEKAFDSFLEMRKKIKKPATEKAIELLIKKINQFPEAHRIPVIEQSILNGWQDFYELKTPLQEKKSEPQHIPASYIFPNT